MGDRHQPQIPDLKPQLETVAEPTVKPDLRAIVLAAMAGIIFLLVVAFAAYGMVYRDEKILAEVFSLVKGGAYVVALWAVGEKIARVLGKQE